MLLRNIVGLAAAAAFAAAAPALAQDRFEDPDRINKLRAAFPQIDQIMRDFAERSRVPGIAYGIIVDGALVHVGTHGLREINSRSPIDTTTVFRIASMTKSFTALAILQLRDAGKLNLDDPAEKYVPELVSLRYPTTDAPKITIRHLLTHSEGFPEDNPWGDQQLAATEAQMSEMIRKGIPFSTSPGTAYEYSNFGFAILGRIVTNLSGMTYDRYIRERVLRPLGMNVTTMEARSVPPARLAHGYRVQDGQWLEEPQLPDGSFGPMGGMLTSISDLSKWVGLMLDAWPPRSGQESSVLRRASLREMQQIWRYNGVSLARDTITSAITMSAGGYGYGLGVRQTCLFRAIVAHSGGLPGFGSVMRWLPDYGVGIVALGNRTYTPWGGVTDQALRILAETGGLVPRAPQPPPVLLLRQDQVSRLVMNWNESLADSLAAMNLYLDESKARRRAAIEALIKEVGGQCRPVGPLFAENALRGRWRMRCANGDLVIGITLAPTEPAQVQFLDVRRVGVEQSLAAQPVCPAPTPPPSQNPSPMQEQTRAHERLTQKEMAGVKRTFAGPAAKPVDVFIPTNAGTRDVLDLVIHFHGAAWLPQQAVAENDGKVVTAAVNLGSGSTVYDRSFSDAAVFDSLIAGITREVNAVTQKRMRVNNVILTGFSAGHGAIRAILREPRHFENVDGILLLDGMHTSYVPERVVLANGGTLDTTNLVAFASFARAAMRGEKRFVITHSEIFPGTFASTTETADWLLQSVGLKRTAVLKTGPRGLQQLSEVRAGRFEVLGYAGNSAPDHIDHFHAMPELLARLR